MNLCRRAVRVCILGAVAAPGARATVAPLPVQLHLCVGACARRASVARAWFGTHLAPGRLFPGRLAYRRCPCAAAAAQYLKLQHFRPAESITPT